MGVRGLACVAIATALASHVGAEEAAAPSLLTLEGVYTGEVMSSVDGGLREGTRYLDNVDLMLSLDGAVAFGIEGLSFFAYGLYDNGGAISGDLVGDAQGVSNIEADAAVRLYELWVNQDLGFASVRVGLYDLNTEFDAIDTAGLFVNPSHGIGPDYAQSGLNGPSIFPVTSLGVRLAAPIGGSLLKFAALDGVPGDPAHPKRTSIRFDEGDGALLAWEMERAWEAGLRAASVRGDTPRASSAPATRSPACRVRFAAATAASTRSSRARSGARRTASRASPASCASASRTIA